MRRLVFQLLAVSAFAFAFNVRTRAADVSIFGILKSQQFLQTNAGSPFLPATNAFVFNTFVFSATNGSVTNATLTPPNAPLLALVPQASPPNFLFEKRFDTGSALDVAYPTGSFFQPANYTVTTYGVTDGTRSTVLTFSSANYPATAQIANFDAAQAIDTTAPFTFSWILASGQASDLVQLTVEGSASNTIFATPFPAFAGALTGLSNAATAPANSLPPGTNLIAHLSVGRPAGLNTNSYPGAAGVSILGKDIQFPIITRPAPQTPRLSLPFGHTFPIVIQFAAETNRNYHFQTSSNLVTWTDKEIDILNSGNTLLLTDSSSTNSGRRYYRIQVGP